MRGVYTKELLERNEERYTFTGIYRAVFGCPFKSGLWIIYGGEKHGKTWFAVKLAEYFGTHVKTLYISAEEGISGTFKDTIKRAKIDINNRNVIWSDYVDYDELRTYLHKRRSPKVVFIDNTTVYDELKNGGLRKLMREFRNIRFVLLAHEDDKGEPYTATAKMAKRLADGIMRVVGLKVFASGRIPGGELTIDETKAALFHGTSTTQKQ